MLLSSKPNGVTHEQWAPVVELLAPALATTKLNDDRAKKVVRLVGVSAVVPLQLGVRLTYDALLGPDAVARFLNTEGAGMTEETKRNYVSAVRLLGRALRLPQYPPQVKNLPRHVRSLAYTETERVLFEQAAARIPDERARVNATWMVKLAFELGMTAAQQQHACGTDVHAWADGLAIWVLRPDGQEFLERPVPEYLAPELLAHANEAGFRHLVNPDQENRAVFARQPRKDLHDADPRLANFEIQHAADAYAIEVYDLLDISVVVQLLGWSPGSKTWVDLLARAPCPTRDRYLQVMRRIVELKRRP